MNRTETLARGEDLACSPEEVAIKSCFLGPQAENGPWLQDEIHGLLESWFRWRRSVVEHDGGAIGADERDQAAFARKRGELSRLTSELWTRFEREIPKFSPRYVGHMFSELSLPAILGHFIALLHNPNNISGESSRVGLDVEKEAVRMLFAMIGGDARDGAGHFTGGGTVANFEAIARARYRTLLWQALGAYARAEGVSEMGLIEASHMGWAEFDRLRARLRRPEEFREWLSETMGSENFRDEIERAFGEDWNEPALIAGATAHYSWKKGAALFGFPKEAVIECAVNPEGRVDGATLREALRACEAAGRPVALVVSVAGTTEFGTVDRVDEIDDELRARAARGRFVWHHVDAAYGGFYASLRSSGGGSPLEEGVRRSLGAVGRANSVTIDPHKLGYVPYSCGVFLCSDRRDYPHHPIDAPYIDFSPEDDPGLFSLEGSRGATGAAATWLAGRALGFGESGHGRVLRRSASAKRILAGLLEDRGAHVPPGLDLNVVCFAVGRSRRLSELNRSTRRFAEWIPSAGDSAFFVSRTTIPLGESRGFLRRWLIERGIEIDASELFLVRLCLMNPFLTSRRLKTDLLAELAGKVAEFQGLTGGR